METQDFQIAAITELESAPAVPAKLSGLKILIVDDEPVNVILLEELLHEEGYEHCKGCTDPRELWLLLDTYRPDLVLLDLMMPHVDGFQVMRRIAGAAALDAPPILVLTADATSETKHRALACGATDFLTKPFDQIEVLLRVKNLLCLRWQHLQLQNQNFLLEEKVKERTRELREAQQQVIQQERMRALGLMASGIAHDFNNALSLILGFGELSLRRCKQLPGNEEVTDDMRMLIVAAEDAVVMVDRLREFYRSDEEEDAHVLVDLNTLVKQAMSLTQPRWKNQMMRNGATVRVALELERIPAIAGNSSELREALVNLIFNAVDAMPEGGTISLRTRQHGDRVQIEVGDTGCGMSEEVRQRCLEPFFTTKGDSGTGLGLAMVYGTIQRHHGDLNIESAPRRGTKFILRFPVADQQKRATESESAAPDRQLRVLLVDDEPLLCKITARYLLQDWHTVETAHDGWQALEKFKAGEFDIVITDQAMPDMNGAQLASAIKGIDSSVRVILLSGFGPGECTHTPDTEIVLRKPLSIRALRQGIAHVSGLAGNQIPVQTF